jgi:hypothetical protein
MKQKKIIAREFLYFISSFLFLVIIYICFFIYNAYQENRIKLINNDIASLNNQYQSYLSRPLKAKNKDITQEKLEGFANFYTSHPSVRTNDVYDLIPELNHDSILLKGLADYAATTEAHKYKYKKEQNLKFPEFFIYSQSDIDSIKYFNAKIELLHNDEARLNNNIISTIETRNYIYIVGLLVFILTFGLRYLYYATKWSIRTIKINQ